MKEVFKRKIKGILFLVLAALLLTGCGDDELAKEATQEILKEGCLGFDTKYVEISGVNKTYYYTGSPIEPKPVINVVGKAVMQKGVDYTLEYKDNTEVGTARIIVNRISSSKSAYICSGEIEFEIAYDPADIKLIDYVSVSGIKDAYAYTGSPIEPKPIIKDLTRDDYDVKYSNNVNPGIASVEITGKGKYSGSKIIEFAIIEKPNLKCLNPYYNGNSQTIAECNGTLENEMHTDASDYNVKCTKKQAFNGVEKSLTDTKQCKILPLDISKGGSIKEVGSSELIVDRIRVTYNGKVLKYNDEYKIEHSSYFDEDSKYIKSVTVTGVGNYTGKLIYNVDDSKNLANATISMLPSVRYDQKAGKLYDSINTQKNQKESTNYKLVSGSIIPVTGPEVKVDNKVLTQGVDYKIEYSDNKGPGTAKATITGINGYTGIKTSIVFYIIDSSCSLSSQSTESVVVEGLSSLDKHNLRNEPDKNGSDHYYVQLYPNQSVTMKIIIPAKCGEIKERSSKSQMDVNHTSGWEKYFTKTYSDLDYSENDKGKIKSVERDSDGNVFYTMTITAGDTLTPGVPDKNGIKNWWAKFSTYRQYIVVADQEKTINYTGAVISVQIIEPTEQKIVDQGKKDRCCCKTKDFQSCAQYHDVESCPEYLYEDTTGDACKEKTDCCCLDDNSNKCYWSVTGICDNGSHAAPATSCGRIEYKCEINYNSATKKLSMIAYATESGTMRSFRTVTVTRELIDGMEPTSITVTSKTYNGVAYFSDGGTATCQKTINLSTSTSKPTSKPTATPAKPVITCKNPTYTGKSLTIATCSGGTISNEKHKNVGSYKVSCKGTGGVTTKSCSIINSKPTATPKPKVTATPVKPAITCKNPTYTGKSLTIATCSGGTISNAVHTNPGSYTVTCTGAGGTTAKSCSIINSKPTTTPKPKVTATPSKKCCCATNYGKDCRVQTTCTSYRPYSYGYSLSECSNH